MASDWSPRTRGIGDDERDAYFQLLDYAARGDYKRQLALAERNYVKFEKRFYDNQKLALEKNPKQTRYRFSLYADLLKDPQAYRGQLLPLRGHVRRLEKMPLIDGDVDLGVCVSGLPLYRRLKDASLYRRLPRSSAGNAPWRGYLGGGRSRRLFLQNLCLRCSGCGPDCAAAHRATFGMVSSPASRAFISPFWVGLVASRRALDSYLRPMENRRKRSSRPAGTPAENGRRSRTVFPSRKLMKSCPPFVPLRCP